MPTGPATATRLRGVWFGVTDLDRSRAFYDLIGAQFTDDAPVDGMAYATLGDARLVFEPGNPNPPRQGACLLLETADADALHGILDEAGYAVTAPPRNEPWGRQLDVLDPDGYPIAFLGPSR